MDTQIFNNEVVLVTGAAKRIGAAIVRSFHRSGAQVVIHYNRSHDAAKALADELNAQRANSAKLVQAQLGSQCSAQQVIDSATNAFGRLDILINNAAQFTPTPLATVTEEQATGLMRSNFFAPLFLAQAALPELRKRRGCMVNLIDVHATGALSEFTVYGPTKAATHMLTRILARDLAPEIRVNGISPGAILWPENQAEPDPVRQAQVLSGIPMQRIGEPADIAATALFLCSPAARYITGQIVAVDGGASVGSS